MALALTADKLDKDTFDRLLESAVDITGAKHVEVVIDARRNVLHINVNSVCVLRVCRVEEFTVRQADKL